MDKKGSPDKVAEGRRKANSMIVPAPGSEDRSVNFKISEGNASSSETQPPRKQPQKLSRNR